MISSEHNTPVAIQRSPQSSPPFRSELLGDEQLAALARQLAAIPVTAKRRSYPLHLRLRDNETALHAARDVAAGAAARNEHLMPDAEWLLDNFFVIEDVLREVQTDLPRGYYEELPVASDGENAGLPRIYGIAVALVAHTDSHLDDERILRFVMAYQEVSPLNIGELWAIPTMLRLVLLENLRRLGDQMMATRKEREQAVAWVRQASGSPTPVPFPDSPSDAFLVGWHHAIRDLGDSSLASSPPTASGETLIRPPSSGDTGNWLANLEVSDLGDVLHREYRRQAANQVSVGNCITSLRLLSAIDWNVFFDKSSLVEKTLRSEPTGLYARQDFSTRNQYRRAVETLAKASRLSEVEVARGALARAVAGASEREKHIGYYLVAEGRRPFARALGCRFPFGKRLQIFLCDRPNLTYFSSLAIVTLLLVLLVLWCSTRFATEAWVIVLVALATLLPMCEIAVSFVNFLACRLLPPRVLPKLDFSSGIPAEYRTVVVIPGMLTTPENASALCERLELHYLANPDPQLRFALLTDFADAPAETMPGEDALLKTAVDGIRKLNERHCRGREDIFFLFHRKRLNNPSEGVWMGWERKRGKLEEFNRLLRGAVDTSYIVRTGNAQSLEARFVLTLDSDTVLPRDAARRLVATLAHPLNRPVLSPDGRSVSAGYGVIQPRVSFLYKTALKSLFARIYTGSTGIDPYSSASSDVYQDLFGSGTFTGKGLYDVDAFQATAGQAFPPNSILSHDLIESNFARCGLATDIEVYDGFPTKYHAYADREQRWIRGDWQLLPWLGWMVPSRPKGRRNSITLLGRWKILDNLRRSLVAPSLVLLLALGWLVLPGSAWAWSLLALAVLAVPLILQLADQFKALMVRGPGSALRSAPLGLGLTAGQVGLTLVFLASQTVLAVDAIARTLYRLFVSKRKLLEWETAAAAEARLGSSILNFVHYLRGALALTALLAALVIWLDPAALPAAAPWLLAWFLSPLAAWWVSRPLADRATALSENEQLELRRTARKTWRFFETFVAAGDCWLPPDNYQEDPKGEVAHRTSPTNIGLYLLSVLSSHDLGHISLTALVERFEQTFHSLDQLERYRGHFLNWYETTTLKPLFPKYVSTVDSGNFLACLIAAKNGLEAKGDEVFPSLVIARGLLDTLEIAEDKQKFAAAGELRAHLASVPASLLGWDDWFDRALDLSHKLPVLEGDDAFWIKSLAEQIRGIQQEFKAFYRWLPELRQLSTAANGLDESILKELNSPVGRRQWVRRLPELRESLAKYGGTSALIDALDRSETNSFVSRLNELGHRAELFANDMDFRFLYNEQRHLFSIGFNISLERLDGAYYDLLASEAALTSYLAVARGVVPRKHWFQLGRLVTKVDNLTGLLSWGGTMFEYLMPRLLLAPLRGTMLDIAQQATVARQREYSRQTRTPWGISESGFYVLSPEKDYQYQSFGVPGLGLKRGLGKDIVIAPYATLLATMIDTSSAVANFKSLRSCGGEGPYGFYEAIDFTPERLPRGEKFRVVKSYMAHHQGMGLCAIANRLLDDIHCRRLHAEPAVRAVELLLQERVPLDAPELLTPKEESEFATSVGPDVNRRLTTHDTPAPRSHILSNGHYTVMLTNSGGGFSTCRHLAVTRWRVDPARDNFGAFIYVRDQATGRTWSAAYQPLCRPADQYEVIFSADKAEFSRRDGAMETRTVIIVTPDQNAEIRRVTLINHDTRPHALEVTSYAEIVLNDFRADLAHPAFGKLFLETEWLGQYDALLCRKRLRSADQTPVFGVHLVSADETAGRLTEHETDRAKFLGRRRTPSEPESLNRRLSGTVGAVLDPIFSLRKTVHIPAGGSGTLTFVTAVAASRDAAVALAGQYHGSTSADRAFDLAWAHSRVELQHLGVSAAESHVFQRLAGHILFPPPSLRAINCLQENRLGQSSLWRFGISGDLPILTVCLSDADGLPLAKQALKAHAFWRGRGFPVDLVLLADRPASYREELFQDLSNLARSSDSRDAIDKPGGVFVRKVQPASEERTLLLAYSRVVLHGDRGTLSDQTDTLARGRRLPRDLVHTRAAEPHIPDRPAPTGLPFFNGIGGFSKDFREYLISGVPPAPWTNVIANPAAGCLTTDNGLGSTWVGNSQTNRLTSWNNDPVSDPPAEMVYLRDEETGHFWSPTAGPVGASVRFGCGFTTYSIERDRLAVELTVFVPVADPVKIIRLRVSNLAGRRRQLSAAYYAEWVLGTTREQCAPFVISEYDPVKGTLLARCAFNEEFGSAVAFAATSLTPHTASGDRIEFLGRNGSLSRPAALRRVGLSNHSGPGLDPCAALMGRFEVGPQQSAEVVFVLGQAPDAANAARLAGQYRQVSAAAAALEQVKQSWEDRLSIVKVKTPEPRLDALVNRWLVYQVLACRLWGRTAFYQSGGAFGFRDQLQDVAALLYAEPGLAREHILRAASRQFPQGDVQHWWHPPSGRGVRTRFSDDFLWLPFIVARYIAVTGDAAILDQEVPFLQGPVLNAEEQESYFRPDISDLKEPLYGHCLRALANGWKLGPHGLPLMGCGDWNDGMNLVGAGGKGESVWVGWFQVLVRTQFAALAAGRGDGENSQRLREEARQLGEALEAHAWDGQWYLRAWFDDGTPLGSHANDECQLDSLSQSWAVLAGGNQERAARAVDSAVEHLFDKQARLIKLFEPPFDLGVLQPGYIKGYVPGIRENGGQYTHGALWLVEAVAKLGRGCEALDLWLALCPISHGDSPESMERYKVEPYVAAADVYGLAPHVGRGGWTWYTGSAAWMYRAALEAILGLSKSGETLTFDPHIPADWPGFEIDYRHGKSLYRCRFENPHRTGVGITEVKLDGEQLPEKHVPLRDDGREHIVQIVI